MREDADVRLFVQHAAWLAPRLPNPSRIGLLQWVGRRLEPAGRARLAHMLPLHHGEQRAAERALTDVLCDELTVQRLHTELSEDIERGVDWAASYVRAQGRAPTEFVVNHRSPTPDRALLGALLALAQSWHDLLGLVDDASVGSDLPVRRSMLRRALTLHSARRIGPAVLDARGIARLRRVRPNGQRAADAIERVLGFWQRPFGDHPDDERGLAAFAAVLRADDVSNADTLLEVTTALSIARAALAASREDWPTTVPWQLLRVTDPQNKYPVISLRSGPLVVEIGKGAPRRRTASGAVERIADRLSPLIDEVLPRGERSRSTGHQPDVVLTFYRADAPHRSLLALGDAKRNMTGSGEVYLRAAVDVAATYLTSFGHAMGLAVDRSGTGQTADLLPAVTLFCRQGTGRPADSAIALLRKGGAQVPILMAFDLEQHFGADAEPPVSESLAAWIGALGRQAHAMLPRAHGRGT